MMEDIVTLVVSGKVFADVPKENLVRSSSYFKTLFTGTFHKRSHKEVYKCPDWSSKAFQFLLDYMLTGQVMLNGQRERGIRKALELSDILLIDGFRCGLARALITSWTNLNMNSAFRLADQLDVRKELEEYCLLRILSVCEKEHQEAYHERITVDILILVTGMEHFWNITGYDFGACEYWPILLQRYRLVLGLAGKLTPRSLKAQALMRNLRLQNLDNEMSIEVRAILGSQGQASRCLSTAFDKQIFDIQRNLGRQLLSIRVSVSTTVVSEVTAMCVAEFDLRRWEWKSIQAERNFSGTVIAMNKKYVTILGECELFVFQKSNLFPQYKQCEKLRNVFLGSYGCDICCYGSRNDIFILNTRNVNDFTKLFKLDVSTTELSECISVPLQATSLICEGDNLYIGGLSLENSTKFQVLEYKMYTNEISVAVQSLEYYFCDAEILHMLVVHEKIYIFWDDCYACLDLHKNEDQKVNMRYYKGFVCEMWMFQILAVEKCSSGIFCLLQIYRKFGSKDQHNDLGMMIAQFYPESSELKPSASLPPFLFKHNREYQKFMIVCN